MNGYLRITEKRQPMKLQFAQMLGRDNITSEGKRKDLDFSQDSIKLLDIKKLKDTDI